MGRNDEGRPQTAWARPDKDSSIRCDASALWEGNGQVPILDYLSIRCGLSKRERALTAMLIKNAGTILHKARYYYERGTNEGREYRRILAAQLESLELDRYECIYFRERYDKSVIFFPVTEDIIEKAVAGQKILITVDGGKRTAAVGSRKFCLDNETFLQDGPAHAVRKSIETAFLSGRTEDYAYVDAVLRNGGRLETKDYSDIANWTNSYKPGRDYETSCRDDEMRFQIEHVRGVKGQVREHWILYDLITGKQQEAKTYIQCRKNAMEMSRRISRYETYAYRPLENAFYRGNIVRMNTFISGPEGTVTVQCTDQNGNDLDADIRELYLREEDAYLPGESVPGVKALIGEDNDI